MQKIIFTPIVKSNIPIKKWQFRAAQENNSLLERSDSGLPKEVEWDFSGKTNHRKLPTTTGSVTYSLTVEDELGRIKQSNLYVNNLD